MAADRPPLGTADTAWLLTRHWQQRTALSWALWPVAALYGLLLRVRRAGYALGLLRSARLPVPVVVVGNVVAGGAGKTPTVIGLVRHLQQAGWQPGVVSRGHGRQGHACTEVTPHSSSADVGDEPCLIAQATLAPMVVGRKRADAGRMLLQRHPAVDIIVCDDGMQHWALQRDLTVVVFDDRGTGNGFLLPAGWLREPWPAAPWGKGQMLVLHTGAHRAAPLPGNAPQFQAQRHLSPTATGPLGQRVALTELRQPRPSPEQPPPALAALAGIARPHAFFDMLRQLGLDLQQTVALPDHADAATLQAALSPQFTWLCTDKDAVKLFPTLRQNSNLHIYTIPLEQTPEPAFYAAIDQALNGLSSPHGHQTP